MLDSLSRRLSTTFAKIARKGRLKESEVNEVLREVRVALLEADVHFEVIKEFIQKIKDQTIGSEKDENLSSEQTLIKVVKDELISLFGRETRRIEWSSSPPTVILMCGLQGSGKTTTCGKLAKWFLKQGKKPMLAACDLQRPAAIKQLQILGEQVGVPVFVKPDETSPIEVAKEALKRCKYLFNDVLIVDTAGRLNIDDALMKELKQIQQVLQPSESFLTLDASIGQESINVAKSFSESIKITGTIFTKLDGDTRGGSLLSVRSVLGVPIKFIGTGEQVDSLEFFDAERVAGRILGMGDMLSLIEKVEASIPKEDTQNLQSNFMKGQWSLEDMLQQILMVEKMGPIKNVMKMIPGAGHLLPEGALDNVNDKKIIRNRAILQSMTRKERKNPDIINSSRKKRIANGSGLTVQDINMVLKQYEEMKKMVKHLSKLSTKQQNWMLSRLKR